MAPPKRSPLQREKDLARTEELHLRGYNGVEIATEMGVSAEQIRQDLKKIAQQYAASTLRNYDQDLNRQLRKLDLLERSAWKFLADSDQDREITTRRQRTKESDDGTETVREASTRQEQRDPDARYMTVIQWCIAERNRLLGLYPPEESRVQHQVAAVTEIVYELAPANGANGMTIVGGNDQPALVDGQVEIIGGTPDMSEAPTAEEFWGVADDEMGE